VPALLCGAHEAIGLITLIRGSIAFIGRLIALIRGVLALIGTAQARLSGLIALIGVVLALIGNPIALIGVVLALIGGGLAHVTAHGVRMRVIGADAARRWCPLDAPFVRSAG